MLFWARWATGARAELFGFCWWGSRCATDFRFPTGVTTFSQEILQRGMINHGIGHQPFQVRVLVLMTLWALGATDRHDTIPVLPLEDGRIADAVLAAQIVDGNPGLMLLQDAVGLVFGKPAARHFWSFRLGQSLTQTGIRSGATPNFK